MHPIIKKLALQYNLPLDIQKIIHDILSVELGFCRWKNKMVLLNNEYLGEWIWFDEECTYFAKRFLPWDHLFSPKKQFMMNYRNLIGNISHKRIANFIIINKSIYISSNY